MPQDFGDKEGKISWDEFVNSEGDDEVVFTLPLRVKLASNTASVRVDIVSSLFIEGI